MIDRRLIKLAEVLIGFSTNLQKGEKVLIKNNITCIVNMIFGEVKTFIILVMKTITKKNTLS